MTYETLTFDRDVEGVKENQRAKDLSRKSFRSKVIDTNVHGTDFCSWAIKLNSRYSTSRRL